MKFDNVLTEARSSVMSKRIATLAIKKLKNMFGGRVYKSRRFRFPSINGLSGKCKSVPEANSVSIAYNIGYNDVTIIWHSKEQSNLTDQIIRFNETDDINEIVNKVVNEVLS